MCWIELCCAYGNCKAICSHGKKDAYDYSLILNNVVAINQKIIYHRRASLQKGNENDSFEDIRKYNYLT